MNNIIYKCTILNLLTTIDLEKFYDVINKKLHYLHFDDAAELAHKNKFILLKNMLKKTTPSDIINRSTISNDNKNRLLSTPYKFDYVREDFHDIIVFSFYDHFIKKNIFWNETKLNEYNLSYFAKTKDTVSIYSSNIEYTFCVFEYFLRNINP